MRVHRYSTQGRGRRVLAAMATDVDVLRKVASIWPPEGLFGSDTASNVVGSWCVEHYRNYTEAPDRAIQARFEHWQEDADKDVAKLVQLLLESAAEEHRKGLPSTDNMLDMAQEHFESVSMRAAVDAAQDELSRGNTSRAKEWLDTRPRISFEEEPSFNPAADIDEWMAAYDDEGKRPLIRLPGSLGEFVEDDLVRDSFVAIMASSSRGKSWWLLDLAYRAVRSHSKVAYFEAGDLSRSQMIRRMGQRALRRPKRESSFAWPVQFDGTLDGLQTEMRTLGPPDPYHAMRAWQIAGRSRKESFKLHTASNSSMTAMDIYNKCMRWADDGFVLDVCLVDYMDILAPFPGEKDKRERINESWKAMRRLSQDLNCLVLTVTQADAGSYDTPLLRRRNFTDDRRKLDHLTGQLALNMTEQEKELGVARFNWLKRRDEAYTELRQIAVAGCIACGCPNVIARFPQRQETEDE